MRAVKAEDRAVPLSNPPLHRPKPAGICAEHKGSLGTRAPVYYRRAVQAFAAERQSVSQSPTRAGCGVRSGARARSWQNPYPSSGCRTLVAQRRRR